MNAPLAVTPAPGPTGAEPARGNPRWQPTLRPHRRRAAHARDRRGRAAASGHPGAPMGMAEMAVALWQRHLKHNPGNPQWADRDRFVLSNGHASMLLYALLHLTGYDLPMAELQAFRQLGSRTPGHPEAGLTPGVETTTGPLGQGLANGVGMALAEKLLADRFNRPGHTVVDHRTWVFVGDGCLMEGVSHEACSLAGTLGLGKLTVLYDANGISIDGAIEGWFADDTPGRFRAYGWNVIGPIDGHDVDAVDAAIARARSSTARPTLIVCRTTIGRGSPNRAGTARAHGEPLGAAENALTRAALGWSDGPFVVPADVAAAWDARARGRAAEDAWRARWDEYRQAFPAEAAEFERRVAGELPESFAGASQRIVERFGRETAAVATRKASQQVIASAGRGAARAARGQRRPHRLEPDRLPGRRCGPQRAAGRAPHPLRRARIRHGRRDERHRAARRLHPVRRHVPDVQRLQPQRDPDGGADAPARDPRADARQHRPGGGRADPPAGGARRQPAADPEPGRLAPVRRRGDGGRLGERRVAG